jgi:hypothetical protein
LAATLAETEIKVVDLSYGGLLLEIPRSERQRLDDDFQVCVPEMGSIPVRLVWARGGGTSGPLWCGVQVVAGGDRADAWRDYVDLFPGSS